MPRYSNLDWEVVVKRAERGHSKPPLFPYALATIDTINEVHGHHEHDVVTFAIGINGLERLITELSQIKEHLMDVRRSLVKEGKET